MTVEDNAVGRFASIGKDEWLENFVGETAVDCESGSEYFWARKMSGDKDSAVSGDRRDEGLGVKGDRGNRRDAGDIAPFLLYEEGEVSNSSRDAARRARFASTSANGLPLPFEFSNGDDAFFSACKPNEGDRLKRAVDDVKAAGEVDEGL